MTPERLLNTIVVSRRTAAQPLEGMIPAVISASPGTLGGVRSLAMAQALLLKLGCRVVPGQCFLANAGKGFDAEGRLVDARAEKNLKALMAKLARAASSPAH